MKVFVYASLIVIHLIGCSDPAERSSSSNPPLEKDAVTPVKESDIGDSKLIHDWKPAVLEGLTVGRSTRGGLTAALGKPDSTTLRSSDLPRGSNPIRVDVYTSHVRFPGFLEVSSENSTEVISEIVWYPKALTAASLFDRFGDKFVRARYKFLICPADSGSHRLIESATGDVEYLENRNKGLVVELEDGGARVRSVAFVRGPFAVFECP